MEDDGKSLGLKDLSTITVKRAIGYGTTALFYAAIPLALLLAAKRRDLSWKDLARAAVKLPFA